MNNNTRSLAALLVGFALLSAACGGEAATTTTAGAAPATTAGPAPTTTAEGASTTTSTTPETTIPATTTTTTTIAATTTTAAPVPTPPAPGTVLITNEDGVYEVTLSGTVTQVIDADSGAVGGIIAFAIDDTAGGVIFQPGRSPWAVHGAASIVYRVEAGSSTPTAFLTPSDTQGLSLEDVIDSGTIKAYYTRLETAGGAPADYTQTLRVFDSVSGTVTELAIVGGWESGSSPISVGGSRIVRNWAAEIWSGVTVSDLSGSDVVAPGNPNPDGATDCIPMCGHAATVSPDGTQIAYAQQVGGVLEIILADLASGTVMLTANMAPPIGGYVESIDLNDAYIVVNLIEEGSEVPTRATIIDIASDGFTTYTAPIFGRAILTRAQITSNLVSWP